MKRLRLNSHPNPHLQSAFNAHGKKMIFEVVAQGSLWECIQMECNLRPTGCIGYNILPGGGVPPKQNGVPWFNDGKINVKRMICPEGFVPGKLQNKLKPHGLLGRTKDDEHRAAIARTMLGKKLPQHVRDKVSAALKGRKKPTVTCPHCLMQGGVGPMGRFHFDKCSRRQAS